MTGQPSWLSSTLSQVFWGSSIVYGALFLIIASGITWAKLDPAIGEKLLGLYAVPWTVIFGAYTTGRKPANGDGGTHDEPHAVDSNTPA